MSDQTASQSPEPTLALIESLCREPMHIGETWYVVSPTWYRRWRKAISGEVDKEGGLNIKDVGPVDNTDIATQDGVIKQDVPLEELQFVPEKVWHWFAEGCGESRLPLPRTVIPRGIQAEPSLELHPLCIRVHVLSAQAVPGIEVEPSKVFVSVKDSLANVQDKILALPNFDRQRQYRIWKLAEGGSGLTQLSCTPEQLKELGAVVIQPSHKTVEDELIEEDDAFVVEPQEEGLWIVADDEVPAQAGTVSTSTSQSTITQGSAPKLFNTGQDFFSEIQAKSAVSGTSSATSSAQKPSAKSTSLTVAPRAKIPFAMDPGTLGLGNMGNTCFMNSALQCLAHTPELTEYFLTGVFEEELNPDNPLGMGGAIANAFGALLHRIWVPGGTGTSYAPREFKQALQRFAPQFSGYQQHDSQELVAFLLDGLHEDLNRVRKKPYVEKPDWEGGGDKELIGLAQNSWEGYMKRNDSVIVDLFQGQYQSTLVCPECAKVSITFDPFMYLTLPLPVDKKWKHNIYYVPWNMDRQHLKIPVEISRDASFKDLRQLLGRWMDVNPDNLLTLEVFSHRFYKDLDDTCLVGDMSHNDIIMCFELPCHAQQSRTYKPQPGDPFIVPVLLSDMASARFSYRNSQSLFGYPFVVVVDQEQATDPEVIYDVVVERLQRWTANIRDLFTWVPVTPTMTVPVQIPISGPPEDAVTEIKANGDIITVEESAPEEGDITDEKASVVRDEDDVSMVEIVTEEPRRVGYKKGIFKLRVQAGDARYGASYNNYGSGSQRADEWEHRASQAKNLPNAPEPPVLLQENDLFVCEFDENMKAYYFGDNNERTRSDFVDWNSWEEYVHPEYTASRKAAAARKNKGISLQDCLDEFTKEEKLGEDDLWYCPICKKHQQATKRFDIWKVPDVLVVHLKRFSNSRMLRDKIDTFVDFPLEGLDLSPMVGECQVAQRLAEEGIDASELGLSNLDEPLMYDLYAVDEHLGGLGGGHYRAYSYNHTTDKWYHFDDSYVTSVEPEAAVNSNAYLLFYRRRTSRPLGGKSHAKVEAARSNPTLTSPPDQEATQLPTPPLEDNSPPASQSGRRDLFKVGQENMGTVTGYQYNDDWATPQSMSRSSPASSLPPLDDDEQPPPFASLFDDAVESSLPPLGLSTHHFDLPDPSSTGSPSSSVAAEPDLDDLDEMHVYEHRSWQGGVRIDSLKAFPSIALEEPISSISPSKLMGPNDDESDLDEGPI
ncbi:hypothetical protein IEO21_05349 [Rhodonia placenta]|uniref:ubiquitinyl hydrolase 1 n=1 Tax=Rhodonia placenta TaxID=104341 RepID=A0A8H7P226_9APHY|nr:hypothetical protein IEO21_05349 [Postia placenta]